MRRSNPLVAEVRRGLAGSGLAHRAYLDYLVIQAVVLFLFWPKSELSHVIEKGDGPDSLLAVVIAVGISVAYYNIRAGAEEILLPGQHSLREWTVATPLKLTRILRGYLCGHILQTLHVIALSSPLLLTAFSVAGGEWSGLAWSLTAVLFQATFYRLAGAVVYMTIGHHDTTTFVSLRAVLLAGYAVAAALLPAASHLVVSSHLLNGGPSMHLAGGILPEHVAFLLVYTVLSVVLAAVLYSILLRQRRTTAASVPLSGAPRRDD